MICFSYASSLESNVRMKRGGGGGGGGAERIFVSSRIQQLAQIKPPNLYQVPMY